ncbi:MAG: glycosylhydrolase-like jelly roll fold domain-containing protein, partial [Opitutales bacterium]
EGAPFDLKRYNFPSKLPDSFDLDFCSPEIIQRMSVQDGRIVLPNGVSYRFLEVVPQRLTLPTARKIEALRKAGATIYTRQPILGPSSLVGYPESDQEMKGLTKNWPQLPASGWGPIIAKHNYPPNFEGGPIRWVHRQTPTADIYFVANTEYKAVSQSCVFRVSGKIPELWDAETGHRYPVAYEQLDDGRTRIQIDFEPARSWFVVFRDESTATPGNPFAQFQKIKELDLPWDVRFDPDWGSDQAFRFTSLEDWSKASDPLVKYYSGTASYQTSFKLDQLPGEPIYIDLGRVEVVASVRLNGKDLGVSWKPPHRFATGDALKAGENILEVKIANTWVNRLVGDEQLPLDSKWKDPTTLLEWPKWFPNMEKRPSGRYTFTTARHYNKKSKLQPSGLLGPVRLVTEKK